MTGPTLGGMKCVYAGQTLDNAPSTCQRPGTGNTASRWGAAILAFVSTAGALVRTSHPVPGGVVTVLVTLLAVIAGHGPMGVLAVAAAVLTGQLSIGWLNDLLDASRDVAAQRVDKPLASGELSAEVVRRALVLATAACVPLSFALGLRAGATHLLVVASGWAYNLGLKSTVISWLPYALAFGALPAVVTYALPGSPTVAASVATATALLGVGAHFLNVVPDIEADRRAGVRGLPQRLGARGSRAAGAASLALACVVLTLGPTSGAGIAIASGAVLGAALLLAAGAALLPARPRSRAPFLCALAVAALALVLLVLRGGALTA